MTVRRIARSALHRTDNDAQVAGYGRALRAIFDDWLRRSQVAGMSTQALGARLQQAAEANYEPAYLRGKRQAFGAATLGPDDRRWVAAALQSNRMYVQRSLEADIQDKATLQRMQGADLVDLGKAFRSRVEQQYGGQLWRVTEAGFRAGARDLGDTVRSRFRLPLRQEDDGEEEQRDDELAVLVALALLLRLSRSRVERVLERLGATVADLATATSETSQAAASALGVTPAALAGAAGQAVAAAGSGAAALSAAGGVTPAELDDAIAEALGIGVADLADLGSALSASGGAGFRMGVQYETQNDGDVCLPCQEEGAGGQDEDGIYWEPLEAPLPGEACRGKGNCRCSLAAVYDTGSGDAIAA